MLTPAASLVALREFCLAAHPFWSESGVQRSLFRGVVLQICKKERGRIKKKRKEKTKESGCFGDAICNAQRNTKDDGSRCN